MLIILCDNWLQETAPVTQITVNINKNSVMDFYGHATEIHQLHQ